MTRSAHVPLLLLTLLVVLGPAAAETIWPVSIPGPSATLAVHEPIIDAWNDGILTARSLVLAQPNGAGRVVQGSATIQAAGEADRATGVVNLIDPQVLNVSFPPVEGALPAEWGEVIRSALPGSIQTIDLPRAQAGQRTAQARQRATASAPPPESVPNILVSETPAVLVYIDGPPRYVKVPDTSLEGMVNTRALMVRDAQGTYYLHLYDGWVSASSLNGPWQVSADPPQSGPLMRAALDGGTWNLLPGKPDSAGHLPVLGNGLPRIVVTQDHTALIVVDGAPQFVRMPNSDLWYAVNTSAHLFRDGAGAFYARIGGNWYRSQSLDGKWQYVAASALPRDFYGIPDDNPKAGVSAALVRARTGAPAPVSQSNVVAANRQTTQLNLIISGDPVLKPIPGTELNFVANASVPVIQYDIDSWYAVENGVWFWSSRATGPWTVTSDIPPEIYAIPPTVPIYQAIHSRVLAASTDVVYYDYAGGGPTYRSEGGATGVEDQGADYQYTPPAGMYWSYHY